MKRSGIASLSCLGALLLLAVAGVGAGAGAGCQQEKLEKKGPSFVDARGEYLWQGGAGLNFQSRWTVETDWLRIHAAQGDLLYEFEVLDDQLYSGGAGADVRQMKLGCTVFDGLRLPLPAAQDFQYRLGVLASGDEGMIITASAGSGNLPAPLLQGVPGSIELTRQGAAPFVSPPVLVGPGVAAGAGVTPPGVSSLRPQFQWRFAGGESGAKSVVELHAGADASGPVSATAEVPHQGKHTDLQSWQPPDNLLPDTPYAWQVKGISAASKESAFSAPFVFTITLAAPTLQEVGAGGYVFDGNVLLQWTTVEWAAQYHVQLAQDRAENPVLAETTVPQPADPARQANAVLSWTPPGPLASGTYVWWVVAEGGGSQIRSANGAFSLADLPVPDNYEPACGAVADVGGFVCWKAPVYTSQVVQWDVQTGPEADFETQGVVHHLAGADFATALQPVENKFCAPLAKLLPADPAGTYQWRVRSTYGELEGAWGETCSLVVETGPHYDFPAATDTVPCGDDFYAASDNLCWQLPMEYFNLTRDRTLLFDVQLSEDDFASKLWDVLLDTTWTAGPINQTDLGNGEARYCLLWAHWEGRPTTLVDGQSYSWRVFLVQQGADWKSGEPSAGCAVTYHGGSRPQPPALAAPTDTAPCGASLDPASGTLCWSVPAEDGDQLAAGQLLFGVQVAQAGDFAALVADTQWTVAGPPALTSPASGDPAKLRYCLAWSDLAAVPQLPSDQRYFWRVALLEPVAGGVGPATRGEDSVGCTVDVGNVAPPPDPQVPTTLAPCGGDGFNPTADYLCWELDPAVFAQLGAAGYNAGFQWQLDAAADFVADPRNEYYCYPSPDGIQISAGSEGRSRYCFALFHPCSYSVSLPEAGTWYWRVRAVGVPLAGGDHLNWPWTAGCEVLVGY